MIDVHSHLLPAIDDGARSVEQSLRVLRRFAEDGVRAVVLTPHVCAGELAVDPDDPLERRDLAYATLRRENPLGPALHLGFEIMLDRPLPSEVARDRRFALAGSRYYLVEFPLSVHGDLATEMLGAIVSGGGVPLVAHAERYDVCSPETVARWRAAGAKIQVDATTLTRATTRGHRARQLLRHGLADVMAGDNHGGRRTVKTGVEYLRGRGADAQARHLAVTNPAAIVDDGVVTEVAPALLKETFIERIRRRARD